MNATASMPQVSNARRFQFSLADACCWTILIAVAAGVWNVDPYFTFLVILWGIPAVIRQRAYCRQLAEVNLVTRAAVLFGSFMLEAVLSNLAAMIGFIAVIVSGLIALLFADVIVESGLMPLIVGWTFFSAYVLGYEILRRCTWPK